MEYLENNKIKNEVIEKLLKSLEDYENCYVYLCDLAETLLKNSEKIMSTTYLDTAKYVINQCEFINNLWCGTIKLTPATCYTIRQELMEQL